MNKSTVSIVTISQLSRHKSLLLLFKMINYQTYQNIKEWIIVEGSQNEEDGIKNGEHIQSLQRNYIGPMEIIYIPYSGKHLSDLRNDGNDICNGDIIVCMDDDDYYPRERIEHADFKLEKSHKLIAGCSDILIYDYYLDNLYQSEKLSYNHSTNNCMAYKKKYLENHRHESGLRQGEEKSFTNNFTEPMVQLDTKKCIVVISHDTNTFSKRQMCINGSNKEKYSIFREIKKPISKYIPFDILKEMMEIFCQTVMKEE